MILGVIQSSSWRQTLWAHFRQPLLLAFFLYFIIAAIGVIYPKNLGAGWATTNKFFEMLLIYFFVATLIDSIQDEKRRFQYAVAVLLCFLSGVLLLNITGLFALFGSIGHRKFVLPLRPLGMHHIWYANLNAAALYSAFFLLFLCERTKTRLARTFLTLSCLLSLGAIFLSLSRGAWVGILLTGIFITYFFVKSKRVYLCIILGSIVACVALYYTVPIFHKRIARIPYELNLYSTGRTQTSLGARLIMWKAALMMFQSNPFLGVGTGNYLPTVMLYIQEGLLPTFLRVYNQPHNMYLFTLATNGILGLLTLLYLFYRSVRTAFLLLKVNPAARLFAFLALAVAIHFMIAGFIDAFFNIQILRYTFALMMGVTLRKSLLQPRLK